MDFRLFGRKPVSLDTEATENVKVEDMLWSPWTRLVALFILILSTRHLFVDGFHFPTYLCLSHMSIALLTRAFSHARRNSSKAQPGRESPTIYSHIWIFLYTAAISGVLIFSYQSLHNVSNTTLWMMIVSLNWDRFAPRDPFSILRDWRCSVVEILRYSTFTICLVLLLLQDVEMSGKGEWLILGAVGCVVLARYLLRFRELEDKKYLGWDVDTIALILSIIPIANFLIPNEWSKSGNFSLSGHWIMLLVSLPAGAVVLHGGVSLRKRASEAVEDCDDLAVEKSGLPWIFISLVLTALVELDNLLFQKRPTPTVTGQWVAFAIASLTTIDIEQAFVELAHIRHEWLGSSNAHESHESAAMPTTETDEDEGNDDLRWHEELEPVTKLTPMNSLAVQTVLSGLVWLLILQFVFVHRSLDVQFSPEHPEDHIPTFDIVIARYAEPIDHVAEAVNAILSIPKMAEQNTTVYIYNKGEDLGEISSKFPLASSVLVETRENVGREGEVILSHILEKQDSIAEHTLFMQAEPHELNWLVARIRQYFVEQTGFLSLSYTGGFCSNCMRCGDNSGWRESGTLVEEIYDETNPGKPCRDVSLTYKSQFIASRGHVQRINREALRHLRESLLNDPEFGYSLERLWGVVMGCPSIASTCPSLLSGWMGTEALGGLGDCQCLDSDA